MVQAQSHASLNIWRHTSRLVNDCMQATERKLSISVFWLVRGDVCQPHPHHPDQSEHRYGKHTSLHVHPNKLLYPIKSLVLKSKYLSLSLWIKTGDQSTCQFTSVNLGEPSIPCETYAPVSTFPPHRCCTVWSYDLWKYWLLLNKLSRIYYLRLRI